MKSRGLCFAFVYESEETNVKLLSVASAYKSKGETAAGMLEGSITVTSMVEDIEGILLTDEERLVVFLFLAFISAKVTT